MQCHPSRCGRSLCEQLHQKLSVGLSSHDEGHPGDKKAGILLQINATAMEYNVPLLSELVDFVGEAEAGIMLMYQLVAVGRGEQIESATLKKEENVSLCEFIADKQRESKTVIEPVAGPQYWPYLLERRNVNGLILKMARKVFHGCSAGRGFVYIKPNGDIWPCPFVEVKTGNVREKSFQDIYKDSPVFKNLRAREETLRGHCRDCRYCSICCGCRGRRPG
ncbi:MAG: radical SAM protein [Deltaproteobacteria bacterium]|nr:radical SAM protein [Deltaproteobacteria bacterium]